MAFCWLQGNPNMYTLQYYILDGSRKEKNKRQKARGPGMSYVKQLILKPKQFSENDRLFQEKNFKLTSCMN